MEFRILGPLEVACDGRVERLAAAKERALLCLLLVDANRVVSADRLIDELWEGVAPESAATSLRVLVSRLRKTLSGFDPSERVVTRSPGYTVVVGPGELDAARFQALVARGRSCLAAGDAEGAARALREAGDLWRGPALVDVADLPLARAEAARLDEARLCALEDRVEAELAAGRLGTLVAELESLTSAHPLRERLWAARMLALYRSGRQADALRVYQELRRHLGDELGIEPSPTVVALETSIIRQDAVLSWQASAAPSREAAGALPSGVVTLLLTDIEGSTPLWEAKPAAMADALTRHDDLLRTIVTAHGGSLLRARGEGDSTFSVFARATDAAEAALEAQDAIAREPWPGEIRLRVRIAMNTGETVERDGDYYGTAVNRAARLRNVAQPGQIVASQSTAEVIIDHLDGVELVELGEQALRGLRRPDRIYELRPVTDLPLAAESLPAAVPFPAALERAASGVFVARDTELARLAALWDEPAGAQRRLVLLAGEAGIGKTRLAAEFARRAFAGDGTVLFGRCDEDGGEPYQPFAEAVRAYLTARPTVAASAAGHLARLVPDVAARLQLPAAPSFGDAEAERRALFDEVASLLGAATTGGPVLLVIDDLHWAARPTLLMLRHLLRSAEGTRLLIVATYRDTDVDRSHPLAGALADLRREVDVTRIALSGLGVEAVIAYVEATAGEELDERERQLADIVHEQTEGNPFFVVEVLRHLVETGLVYRAEGRWRTDITSADDAGLPEGVRDVITRRLSRLSDDANKTLAMAAVIGPEFALSVLERVTDVGADSLLDMLEQSVRAGLISESGSGRYAFTHALIRQTLYGELMTMRRARMHRQVGEAIESLPGAEENVAALAHHFFEAAADGQVAKAVDYSLAASRRAMERLAHEEAIGHLERAIAILELDVAPDDGRRADLYYTLAVARWSCADGAGAQAAARTAATAARASEDGVKLAHIAVLLGALVGLGMRDREAEEAFESALAQLGTHDRALRARVLAALGRYKSFGACLGLEGDALTAEALSVARDSGDAGTVLSALNARILALQGLGRTQEQHALAEELIVLAGGAQRPRSLVEGLVARCQANIELGHVDQFERDIADLETIGERLRWWLPAAFAALSRACHARERGDFDSAAELAHAGSTIASGYFEFAAAGVAGDASADILLGEPQRAVDRLRDVVQESVGIRNAVATLEVLAVAHTDPKRATELLQRFVHDEVDVEHAPMRPIGLAFLAETCARVRYREASRLLHDELTAYRGQLLPIGRGGGTFGATDRYVGMLEAVDEQWDEAERSFQSALGLEGRIGATVFTAQTRYWYGRMLGDRGRPGDREQAFELLTNALDVAEKLGLAGVACDARAILPAVGGSSRFS